MSLKMFWLHVYMSCLFLSSAWKRIALSTTAMIFELLHGFYTIILFGFTVYTNFQNYVHINYNSSVQVYLMQKISSTSACIWFHLTRDEVSGLASPVLARSLSAIRNSAYRTFNATPPIDQVSVNNVTIFIDSFSQNYFQIQSQIAKNSQSPRGNQGASFTCSNVAWWVFL